MVKQILTWKCEKCGKMMHSLSENQLDAWIASHESAHKIRDKKQREDEQGVEYD